MPDITGCSRGMRLNSNPNVRTNDGHTQTLQEGTSLHGKHSAIMERRSEPDGAKRKDVIDLTEDPVQEESDLQRAIALSLQSSDIQATTEQIEEENVTRALKESMTGILGSNSRPPIPIPAIKYTIDPSLKLRSSHEWPVGLKNVGNTCWFNAVVQPLFHLPCFRNLILNFKLPTEGLSNSGVVLHRNLRFMSELKELFAIMANSQQNQIDPSKCISILQESFLSHSSKSQQDTSEFTHKLLDWLEDAFKRAPQLHSDLGYFTNKSLIEKVCEVEMYEETLNINNNIEMKSKVKVPNPIIELFYGEYRSLGSNGGSKTNTFGLLPLFVDKVHDLHDSIEHTLSHEGIIPGEEREKESSQEVWFTTLPPVLTFELSRFHFNQVYNKAEKIHSKLDFPKILYMDRYMEANMQTTKQCREQCQILRKKLKSLKEELKSLKSCEIQGTPYAVTEVLRHTAAIASKRRKKLAKNNPAITVNDGSSPCKRVRATEENIEDEEVLSSMDMEVADNNECNKEKEAEMVEKSLLNWVKDIEQELLVIKNDIQKTETALDGMYEDETIKKLPYTLHAVLVHQGHALAGHYWAFVHDHSSKQWMKFNDESVIASSFEEVLKDSVGGRSNDIFDQSNKPTAYCLIYVDSNRPDLIKGKLTEGLTKEIINTDEHLINLIAQHNQNYQKELDDWKQQNSTAKSLANNTISEVRALPGSGDATETTSVEVSTQSESKKSVDTTTSWHYKACKNAINEVSGEFNEKGAEFALIQKTTETPKDLLTYGIEDYMEDAMSPSFQNAMLAMAGVHLVFVEHGEEAALLQAVKNEWARLHKLSQEPITKIQDARLQHIAVYMFKNNVARKVIERAILEQFSDSRLSYDHQSTLMMKCAKRKLRELSPEDKNTDEYEKWLKFYTVFCKATCCLVKGIELFNFGHHDDALTYLVNILKFNRRIFRLCDNDQKPEWNSTLFVNNALAMDNLQNLAVYNWLSTNSDAKEDAIDKLKGFISPCVHILSDDTIGGNSEEDNKLVEEIREAWCTFCGKDTPENHMEKLSDALQMLIDAPIDCLSESPFKTPPTIHPYSPQSLCQRFENVMQKYQNTH